MAHLPINRGFDQHWVDYDGALIQKQFKIVTGHQGGSGFWTGPVHPNASGLVDPVRNGTVPCTIDLSRTRFCSLPFTPNS